MLEDRKVWSDGTFQKKEFWKNCVQKHIRQQTKFDKEPYSTEKFDQK